MGDSEKCFNEKLGKIAIRSAGFAKCIILRSFAWADIKISGCWGLVSNLR
jgi:hypothetical protein